MKAATVAARTALMESVDIRALPKVRAEWEHNRFSKLKQVNTDDENKVYVAVTPDNDPADIEWNSIYDINSITMPNRPGTGIAKARLSEPIILQDGYRDKPTDARYYLAASDDTYKYWSSSQRSKLTPVATGEYDFATPITLTLMYDQLVTANKLVVGFDLSYARPKSYNIQVTKNGTTWTTVGSNIVPDAATGQITLYLASDGSQSWGSTPVYTGLSQFLGIRLVVTSMNEAYSNLDVIQMGLRLENDLSEFVIGYDRDFEISERSFIAPLGKSSSNTGSIEFTNIDLRFNNENSTLYKGLIDKKVKFTVDISVDATRQNGSADERHRELTMWADSWGGQDEDSVTVSLKDSSVFLQEIDMPKVFWENMTVGAIIWQLMDTIGMTNYNYTRDVLDTGQVIPYFWSIEDGTVWEQISELAEGTQTAVWFDEYDVLQIKTRKAVFGPGRTVSWNLDAVRNGQKLPDIIDISGNDDMAVNRVDISWKPAEFQETKGIPVMETVWEPEEEDVILRATPLTRNLMVNQMEMWIKTADSVYWPYESLVNIRGEIIRYHGKEYAYYDAGAALKYKFVYNKEEKDALDAASHPNLGWSNTFTGRLAIKERGVGGSGTTTHYVKSSFYTGKATGVFNNFYWPLDLNNGGMFYNPDGTMTLSSVFGPWDYFAVDHEAEISSSPNATYGTRIRFPSNNIRPDQACAGIRFDGDWGDTGYWLELSPTYIVEQENRFYRHELSLVVMPANGPGVRWPIVERFDNHGYPVEILPDKWYDVEVRHALDPQGGATITAYINGVYAGNWHARIEQRPPSQRKNSLFVRGNCKADFEYFYAMNHDANYDEGPDQSSYLDLTTGSFTSGFIEREWRFYSYLAYNRNPSAFQGTAVSLNSPGNFFFDEFGPIVHEMREFTVEFDKDKVPVGHSYPYFSAQDQVACLDYNADAFGAKFTLVNTMRRDATVKGEDSVTLGSDNKISQKMFVYGRTLSNPEKANELVKKDEDSIRRKGTISLEFDNRWIQTEQAANDLGQWVLDQWAVGVDEVTVELFGNFLLQLGDLVTMNYPAKGMSPVTHKYYVVAIKNAFNNGLTTSLTLRRARS